MFETIRLRSLRAASSSRGLPPAALLPLGLLLAATSGGCSCAAEPVAGPSDAGPRSDTPSAPDAGRDAGPGLDAGPLADTGPGVDAGPGVDTGPGVDAGLEVDTGPGVDAGPGADAGPGLDAGPGVDGGTTPAVVAVSAGGVHTCALYADGAVWCWGADEGGALGRGASTMVGVAPTRITGVDAVAIAAGGQFTCAITRAGGVVCWGTIQFGSVLASPTAVAGLPAGPIVEIAAGQNHACARAATGPVYCWGANHHGHLGDGTTTNSASAVVSMSTGARDLGLGQQHSCAAVGNTIRCWGWSSSGQAGSLLDNNVTPNVIAPFLADSVPEEVDGGDSFSCVRIGGAVGCWGSDSSGGYGDGATVTTTRLMPVAIVGLANAASISVGGDTACIRRSTGTISCWGDNGWGSASGATMGSVDVPTDVAGLPTTAASVSVGPSHTCALLTDGDVWCWGHNGFGALGDPAVPTGFGTGSRMPTPVAVVGLP